MKGSAKVGTSEELLGCSIAVLKERLESLFSNGMTWDNYGKNGWHIDHIVPCASFDLSDPEQQKKCFHYTNLQPMWGKDNLSKGAKIMCKQVPYTGFTTIQTIKTPVLPSDYCTPKSLTEFSKPQPTRQ